MIMRAKSSYILGNFVKLVVWKKKLNGTHVACHLESIKTTTMAAEQDDDLLDNWEDIDENSVNSPAGGYCIRDKCDESCIIDQVLGELKGMAGVESRSDGKIERFPPLVWGVEREKENSAYMVI